MTRLSTSYSETAARTPWAARALVAALALSLGFVAVRPAAGAVAEIKKDCPDWATFIDKLTAPAIGDEAWTVTIDGVAAGTGYSWTDANVVVLDVENPPDTVTYTVLLGESSGTTWGIWTEAGEKGCRLIRATESPTEFEGPVSPAERPKELHGVADAATTKLRVAYTKIDEAGGAPKTPGGLSEKGESCFLDKHCASTKEVQLSCRGPKRCTDDLKKSCTDAEDCKDGACRKTCA